MSRIINAKDFDFEFLKKIPIQKRHRGSPGRSGKLGRYKDIITAFDIETTRLPDCEHSVMYIWQWQFGKEFTVIGRTWDEFIWFVNQMKETVKRGQKYVVYVFNLSYEFQFLSGIYHFEPSEVFAMESRKILKCHMMQAIEFRCAYFHSNSSLKMYLKDMRAEHQKLDGDEFDYSQQRYSWTQLTEKELEYCVNDVLGLVEALENDMKIENDNLYTLPLTATGYPRRDCRKAMNHTPAGYVKDQLPDYELYKMLRQAFRGGNTHCNRYYTGQILDNVSSADRSSAYPYELCNSMMPVSPFLQIGRIDFDELIKLIAVRHRAVIMRVAIWGVRLQDPYWGCPYLSTDKCRNIDNARKDNGRILSADYLETTITDVDLRILLDEYEWDDFIAFDVAWARYGYLPPALIKTVQQYYSDKTALKTAKPGVTETEEEANERSVRYVRSKQKLNSCYGMMAQDPVKDSIEYHHGEFIPKLDDPQELLDKYNRNAFLCYQWGVWITAWARYHLEDGIKLAHNVSGYSNAYGPCKYGFVYCDTDSVKYLGKIDWSILNKPVQEQSKKSGSFAKDPKGKKHYMGVFEYEGTYQQFSSLGAKKYTYVDNGELHVTISGVGKSKGAKELKDIRNFNPGFIFTEAGGTESIYNDLPEPFTWYVDGHEVKVTSNIYIKDSSYTLGITQEYEDIISDARLYIAGMSQLIYNNYNLNRSNS